MVRSTLCPAANLCLAAGRCEITRPLASFFDFTLVTLPVRQWAAAILRFAVANVLPLTFGTTQNTLGFGFGIRSNVALTVLATSIVTVHEPLPLHAPCQPANVEPAAGVADNVTVVPWSMFAAHAEPQLMP